MCIERGAGDTLLISGPVMQIVSVGDIQGQILDELVVFHSQRFEQSTRPHRERTNYSTRIIKHPPCHHS